MSHIVQFINILEKKVFTLGEDNITLLEMNGLNTLLIHRGKEIEEHGILMGIFKDSDDKNFLIKPSDNPN